MLEELGEMYEQKRCTIFQLIDTHVALLRYAKRSPLVGESTMK